MSSEDRLTNEEHRSLLTEIEAEARRRGAAGAFDPEIERLDSIFDALAPSSVGDELRLVLERAELATFVDNAVPTASNLPGGQVAKKLLRKTMGWYFGYVTQQINEFNVGVASALDVLARRLEQVEAMVPAADPRVAAELSQPLPVNQSLGLWATELPELLVGVDGRVAVAEVVDEGVITALADAGHDVYGVDPLAPCRDWNGRFDIRADDALSHLDAVGVGSLGALVLMTCTDRWPAGELISLLDVAVDRVMPGGRLIVIGTDPDAWAASCSPIEADLSQGRPFHSETWEYLLRDRGILGVTVHHRPPGDQESRSARSFAVTGTVPRPQPAA